jgi:hypothetical protein
MVDLTSRRRVCQCRCTICENHPDGEVAADHAAINRVMGMLDERQRRLFAGLLAMRRGHGGISRLSEITGLSRTTIRRGMDALRHGIDLPARRSRQAGGGRKPVEKKSPAW